MASQIDYILLYIDNEPHALAWVLNWVQQNEAKNPKPNNWLTDFSTYIKNEVPKIMQLHRDSSSAFYLEKEYKKLGKLGKNPDSPEYWQTVYNHYINKIKEGCDMSSYLK